MRQIVFPLLCFILRQWYTIHCDIAQWFGQRLALLMSLLVTLSFILGTEMVKVYYLSPGCCADRAVQMFLNNPLKIVAPLKLYDTLNRARWTLGAYSILLDILGLVIFQIYQSIRLTSHICTTRLCEALHAKHAVLRILLR